MSGAERARWFRERRKAAAEKNANSARNFSAAADLASTSTTGIPVLMDVTNEQTIDISIESTTELRDVNISRSEAMENHWRSADNRFKTVFEANPIRDKQVNEGPLPKESSNVPPMEISNNDLQRNKKFTADEASRDF
ncbi:hypothetical protein ACJJTC_010476 [Scirpophaga incertulas]